ncbi:hypothetical protein GJU43_07140 [Flavobacterium sp. LC2016-23]|uniref:hypothetical protein n=1 Tax=Flavobacterium sp. LC2016-23 TaxID=2666330 RepID=UPI0012B10A77|nr:hypothetical protein [Flavobacterium sp. LC2016-23]MRX39045.1 hypothetical protein [Flavobacterium sp. LC2016-23]
MKQLTILLFLLNFAFNNLYCQEVFAHQQQRHKFNKYLITNNLINKVSKKKFEKGYEYEGKYLGQFITKNDKKFYIINSSYVNLQSLHSDNQIFVYNAKKEFVGYYNVATDYQLPIKLVKNILFFKLDNCINKVKLKNGLPKLICTGCNNEVDCIELQ